MSLMFCVFLQLLKTAEIGAEFGPPLNTSNFAVGEEQQYLTPL
jgi:hypothetical protein